MFVNVILLKIVFNFLQFFLRYACTVLSNLTVYGIAWLLFAFGGNHDTSELDRNDAPKFQVRTNRLKFHTDITAVAVVTTFTCVQLLLIFFPIVFKFLLFYSLFHSHIL